MKRELPKRKTGKIRVNGRSAYLCRVKDSVIYEVHLSSSSGENINTKTLEIYFTASLKPFSQARNLDS